MTLLSVSITRRQHLHARCNMEYYIIMHISHITDYFAVRLTVHNACKGDGTIWIPEKTDVDHTYILGLV
jgi:hypothetical protein